MSTSGDPGHIVTVFRDVPGGFLPVSEFSAVHAELYAARERLQHLSDRLVLARVLWVGAGFVTGLICGLLLQP